MLEQAAIALNNGRIDKAIELAEQSDDCAEKYMAIAACYKKMQDDRALCNLEKAHSLAPDDAEVSFTLGSEYVELRRHADAVRVLKGHPEVKGRMALAQAHIGLCDIDKAIEIYRECISKFPDFLPAYISITHLIEHDSETPCKPETLEGFIDSIHTPADKLENVHNCLGYVYEGLGNYTKAFEHYSKCAGMRRKQFPDNLLNVHRKQFNAVRKHYTPELIKDVPAAPECPLVFVFGMPRSGTTLTEQILVSHPDIDTLGETTNVNAEIQFLAQNCDVNSPAEALKKYIKRRVGKLSSRFIVDKMCGNYQYIGLMYQLFPNAKFIYVKRDAVNNCLAAWSTLFSNGHGYSYSFNEMAAEYNLHCEYMKHWFDVLPEGTIHQVDYERLVENQRYETASLLNYVGAKWVDECMHPEKVKRDVHTASLAQVIKPVYTTSVSRAEKFGAMLNPFKEALV